MITLKDFASKRSLLIISILIGLFIIYPNIAQLPWDLPRIVENTVDNINEFGGNPNIKHLKFKHFCFKTHTEFWSFFIFRYLFFCLTIWALLSINLIKLKNASFGKRALISLLATMIAYGLYILISLSIQKHVDCFTIHLLFQFIVACVICLMIGYAMYLHSLQLEKEREIEQLKSENLQSRCDALMNQINPHFFFNSLNSLTYLIRDGDKNKMLAYVDKLSDVFRTTLRKDLKGLTSVRDELKFVDSFRYLLEVRFANKLNFFINVKEEAMDMKLPALSLLPLIENVVVHNAIDSEHKMDIHIEYDFIEFKHCLQIWNPIYPKMRDSNSSGTGLINLKARVRLLTHKELQIEHTNDHRFLVTIPLI